MPYNISTADVEARWRPLSDDEAAVAATYLDDLVNDLDLKRPLLSPLVEALAESAVAADNSTGLALERVIVAVLATVVKRALRNPDTLRSTSIGADGGIGVGYDNTAAALFATSPVLTRADLSAIDAATTAVGGEAPGAAGSVKLQAYSERYTDPDLTILPLP